MSRQPPWERLQGEPTECTITVQVWPDGTVRLCDPSEPHVYVFDFGPDACKFHLGILREWLSSLPNKEISGLSAES